MKGVEIAKKYEGLEENKDKDQIMELLKSQDRDGDIAINPATTSWCAAWINFCERSVGNEGTGKLNAQSFRTYGTHVDLKDAEEGDICVFHFAGEADWQGHVTYYLNSYRSYSNGTMIECLGGNQTNSVKESSYGAGALLAIRRPPNETE